MFKENRGIIRLRDIFILILFIYTILPFLVLMLYNHPSSDDFTYTNVVLQKGFFNAQSYWYHSWSGRYIGTAILSLNPLVFHSLLLYKLVPLLILSGLIYSFYFLIDNLFSELSKKNKWMVSFLFIIAYFYQMPKIVSGLYWLASAGTYQLSVIFTLFMFGNIIKYIKQKKKKNFYYAIILLFLLIGSNETTMLIVDLLLFIIFILYHFSFKERMICFDKKHQNIFIIGIVLGFVFSLIVILAPGNSIRSQYFPNKHQLGSFIKACHRAFIFCRNWTPFIFLISLLLLSFFDKKVLSKFKLFAMHPISAFLVLIGITYIGFFPAFWSMGEPPPLRTVNVIYFFYIMLWFYFILSLFLYLNNDNNSTLISDPLIIILIIAIGTLYLKENNVKLAYNDWLSGRAKSYNEQMSKRYQMIQKFKSNHNETDTLVVPKLKNTPKTIFFKDFTSNNVKNWRNTSYAKYYQIPAIRTKK